MSVPILALLLVVPQPDVRAQDLGTPVTFSGKTFARTASLNSQPMPGMVVFHTGSSDPITTPFDTIIFQGILPAPGLRFEASRRRPGGRWSSWKPAYLRRFPNGRFWARASFSSAAAGNLRLRALDDGQAGSQTIELFTLEAYMSGAEVGGSAAAGPAPRGGGPAPAADKPPVVTRAQWGARSARQAPVSHVPSRMTQHHTAGFRPATLDESLKEVLFIQDFHQSGRGWSDIGYHFLLDAEGRIFQGRLETDVGAHVANRNNGNVGIALMGFHHPPHDHPISQEQLQSLKTLGRWLIGTYGIPASSYAGHRDLGQSDCPGDGLYGRLDQIRDSFRSPEAVSALASSGFIGRLRESARKAFLRQ